MDGAGLGNRFSMPRQSFGATANDTADVGSSMGGSFGFPSSQVGNEKSRARVNAHNIFSYPLQSRRSLGAHSTVTPLPFLGTPLPSWGGGQSNNVFRQNGYLPHVSQRMALHPSGDKIPKPCPSLMARLSITNVTIVNPAANKKSDMKSVDRTAKQFAKRHAALPSEDWILHLDTLEIERAVKHQWSPRGNFTMPSG